MSLSRNLLSTALPKEPVPPVMRRVLSLKILIIIILKFYLTASCFGRNDPLRTYIVYRNHIDYNAQ